MIKFLKSILKKRAAEFSIPKEDLIKYLPQRPIIVEAGICDGTDTLEFAKIFPEGKIHGFECLPHYLQLATQRLSQYSNVALYPFALNDTSADVEFHVSTLKGEFYGSGSLLAPNLHKTVHPEIKFDRQIKVKSISLDDWMVEYKIDHVDFLWLDLQGAELRALHGANKILKDVKAIFTEVSLIETYKDVPLYGEVKSFLKDRGFNIAKEYLTYRDMGNVLFVK